MRYKTKYLFHFLKPLLTCTFPQVHPYKYTHIVNGNGGYTDRQLADYIKEMSSVAKATNMNEHKKATVETVNGKWPVAMETL